MNEALSWLGDIIRGLLKFVPRLVVIKSTEGGVAFVRGTPRQILPGRMLFYWPLWTELYCLPVNRQTIDLRGQAYVTSDMRVIAVSGVVVYDVRDPMKACTVAHDLDVAIRDIALGTILRALRDKTLAQIYEGREAIDSALERELRAQTRNWGVSIISVFLSDLAPCSVIKVMSDQGSIGVMPIPAQASASE